jgi:hypothetical protein
MRRTRVTPLHYLAATDASGSVARQQKITHAHESPYYHYTQFPHPFAITYRGKKYSRILFGQPSYIPLKLWSKPNTLHNVKAEKTTIISTVTVGF